MLDRIMDGFAEEFESTSYEDSRVAQRAELALRKMGYRADKAYYFSLALIEEDESEETKHVDIDTLYMMAMNWLAHSYTFISKGVVDSIKESVYSLCLPCDVNNIFIQELTDEIKEKIVEQSLNSRPTPSSDQE